MEAAWPSKCYYSLTRLLEAHSTENIQNSLWKAVQFSGVISQVCGHRPIWSAFRELCDVKYHRSESLYWLSTGLWLQYPSWGSAKDTNIWAVGDSARCCVLCTRHRQAWPCESHWWVKNHRLTRMLEIDYAWNEFEIIKVAVKPGLQTWNSKSSILCISKP